jgi:ATP-binding cassette subfamily F protein 3
VFRNLDVDIDRGDRIAFVGNNGAGKSTLARIIAGVEPFDAGERKVGHNVIVAYFAQHQAEELEPEFDVLQTADAVATGDIRKQLRNLLGCFLFSGDDVFKQVRVLSGGEKSRLALAKMLLQPSNLVVLDEPTNHLDMRSKSVLQQALGKFEGSCIVVSHDRDFLDPLVNKVIEFRRGRIKTYLGNVSDYIDVKKREQELLQQQSPSGGRRATFSPLTEKERRRSEAEWRQRRYQEIKPIQDHLALLEEVIAQKENEKAAIETTMASGDFYRDGEKAKVTTSRYRAVQQELADAYYQWDELSRELERLQALYRSSEGRR